MNASEIELTIMGQIRPKRIQHVVITPVFRSLV